MEALEFGAFYEKYYLKIRYFLCLKINNPEEAEDLAQQVFLKAWSHIDDYKKHDSIPFSSWLYRIARNLAIDVERTRKETCSLDVLDQESIRVLSYAPTIPEIKIDAQKMILAMRSLKNDYQDVIIMRYLDEMTIREIACAFHKSEEAVRVLRHRAVRALKKLFQ